MNSGKPYNPHLVDIIKKNLIEPCYICCTDHHTSKFVFGCCGAAISANCLIDVVKTTSYIKCPSCRTVITDETTEMCFFVTTDQ